MLQEARTVASTLGFEEKFKQKRQRKQKSTFGESSSLAHEHENEVEKFKVEVFYVSSHEPNTRDIVWKGNIHYNL